MYELVELVQKEGILQRRTTGQETLVFCRLSVQCPQSELDWVYALFSCITRICQPINLEFLPGKVAVILLQQRQSASLLRF